MRIKENTVYANKAGDLHVVTLDVVLAYTKKLVKPQIYWDVERFNGTKSEGLVRYTEAQLRRWYPVEIVKGAADYEELA
jgi:hypothetical protein